jgi:hypothetical protein
VNSESYGNEDPGKINADGFAVKMRVGEGNRLEGCYSHDNIDDGFDLFNKIEDGANGVVVIENSIARNNTSNGFKLGGEGQPVAHEIRNSIAIGNHLDGFTDNFNPGKLVVVNNVAVDNQRFNYLFRPSPYGKPELSDPAEPAENMMMPLSGKITTTLFASVNAEGKTILSAEPWRCRIRCCVMPMAVDGASTAVEKNQRPPGDLFVLLHTACVVVFVSGTAQMQRGWRLSD